MRKFAQPQAIRVNVAAMDRLRREVMAGFSSPDGRRESGGLLLGARSAGGEQITIEAVEPIPCDYSLGASYALNEHGIEKMRAAMVRLSNQPESNLTVLGFYRGHIRPDVYADFRDLSLLQACFGEAGALCLLIKPSVSRPFVGALFFCEEGRLQRHPHNIEFPREGYSPLRPETASQAAASSSGGMGPGTSAPAQASNGQTGQAPPPPPLPSFTPPHHTPPAFPSFANSTPPGYTPPASPFPPPSAVTQTNYQISKPPAPDPPLPPMFQFASDFPDTPETPESSPRRINAWMVVAGLAVLVLASVGVLQWQRSRVPSGTSAGVATRTSPSSLGLSVERVGNDLRVSWNRNDATVARAQAAILVIHDGSNPQQDILLDGNQLRNGSVLYSPVSGYVQFRLEMLGAGTQTASESVLAISGRQRPPDPTALLRSTPSNVDRAARRTPETQSRVSTPPTAPVSSRLSTPAPPVSTRVQPPPVSSSVSAPPSQTVAKQSAPPAERSREPKRIFVPPASAPGTQQVRVVMVDPPPSQRGGQTVASSPLAGNVSFAAPPPPVPAPPAAVPAPESKPQVIEAKPQVNESKPLVSETRAQPPEAKPQVSEPKAQPTQTTTPLVIAPPAPEPSASVAYVPPRPLVQTQPALPREIRSMLFGEATVDVKVKTDPTGKVTGVEAVSKPGPLRPFLERAALDAARLWRFTPARMGDRAVAGETVVQFTFRSAQGK